MIRYLCRPALATERVELQDDDTIVRLRLKTPWWDGMTHIRMAAAEFVLRLLALIPAPRKKQFRHRQARSSPNTCRRHARSARDGRGSPRDCGSPATAHP